MPESDCGKDMLYNMQLRVLVKHAAAAVAQVAQAATYGKKSVKGKILVFQTKENRAADAFYLIDAVSLQKSHILPMYLVYF